MKNKMFYQGFAVAVGTMARNGHGGEAVGAMDSNGVSLSDLVSSGADNFDLDPIRQEYRLQCRNSDGRSRVLAKQSRQTRKETE
jgi:hypothetical protein